MKNRYILSLCFVSVFWFLVQVESKAQLSQLFQTPALYPDLPIFNPAFTGDVDKFRVYGMFGYNRITLGDDFNNVSTIIGADKKQKIQGSNIFITYGGAFLYNETGVRLSSSSNLGLDIPNNDLKYRQTTFEGTFGGRLPIRQLKKKTQTKKKKNKKDFSKLSTEATAFLRPVNESQNCSNNTIIDFLAFNIGLEYNAANLVNQEGFVFNDQITTNPVSQTLNPFNISSDINDPILNGGSLERTGSFDFSFGFLYHRALNDHSVLRASIAVKRATAGFFSVPNSDQSFSPIKVIQVRYKTLYSKRIGVNLNLTYLDQNEEIYPEFNEDIKQWRLDFSLPIFLNAYNKRVREGKHIASFNPGLSAFYYNNTISAVSVLLGARIKTNTNKDYKGNQWLFFMSYDMHIGDDSTLAFRNTVGNARIGLTLEGWD